MAARKLLPLLALALVAIVALSALPAHATALVADREHVARHAHGAVARRKRSDPSAPSSSGRCQPRPSSSAPAPTSSAAPAPAPPPMTSAAPPSTSSAPPAPSPTTSTSTGKRCIPWTNDPALLPLWNFPKVSMLYNWDVTSPNPLPSHVIYAPMLWGYKDVSQFQSTVVAGYSSMILGQNEPNEPSQANMSPQDAFNMWMTYINPLKDQGYQLVSPACTNDAAGQEWYKTFFGLCSNTPGCVVDTVAFHAYTTNSSDVKAYAEWLYSSFGRHVMITEIADQDFSTLNQQATMDEIYAFAGDITSFVDQTPWMDYVCPFGVMPSQYLEGVSPLNELMNGDGSPNDLARAWLS